MKAVGIICEYNPFHNGHIYHIEQVKKQFPNHVIVLVMSGPFTQRADASILTKWEKTKIALTYQVDLVIELPFVFATGGADLFAKGAITILNELQVEYLVFGSEENNIQKLSNIALIWFDSKFQENIKQLVSTGINYPTAVSKSIKLFTGLSISTPNDLLAVSYIKEIKRINSTIIPVSIQRTNSYHDTHLNDPISSASGIRAAIQENKDIRLMVPEITLNLLHREIHTEAYFPYLKYKILSEMNTLIRYHEVTDSLAARIRKSIVVSNSLDELIHLVKSKNETYSKLKRIFLYILCGFTVSEAIFYQEHPFIRILGFSEQGQCYLKFVKKEISIPIISNYSNDSQHLLDLDLRIHRIYCFIWLNQQYFDQEIKQIPIKKESNQ